MAIKDRTFEKEVFKELDLVWKTYLNKWVWIKHPLMDIILRTIWKTHYRYYPIYTRENTWYRQRTKDTRWPETYYDKVNHVRDYAWNKIDFGLDKVVWWYPPILTWLFVERPHNERHWDLLIYLIKKRYANKENGSSETVNWGTKTKSIRGSEER